MDTKKSSKNKKLKKGNKCIPKNLFEAQKVRVSFFNLAIIQDETQTCKQEYGSAV